MNKAFIFPGQGSQYIGMGKDFHDTFPVAKETFQLVDEVLKFRLSNLIFNGPEEDLTLTVNTQPALMTVSLAIINVLLEQTKKSLTGFCQFTAGHSLGEYSALCAGGSFSLEDTALLLKIRGEAMQEAVGGGVGAMAACIGIELEVLEHMICTNITAGICEIANDNIKGQIVISGHTENIDMMTGILKAGGYKAIKLKVSAPFHCQLMKGAEEKMSRALEEVMLKNPIMPVISNITALPTLDPLLLKSNLVNQVCGRVRWRETLQELENLKVTEIVEIGAGSILTNMLRKTNHSFKVSSISTVKELEEYPW